MAVKKISRRVFITQQAYDLAKIEAAAKHQKTGDYISELILEKASVDAYRLLNKPQQNVE